MLPDALTASGVAVPEALHRESDVTVTIRVDSATVTTNAVPRTVAVASGVDSEKVPEPVTSTTRFQDRPTSS